MLGLASIPGQLMRSGIEARLGPDNYAFFTHYNLPHKNSAQKNDKNLRRKTWI